MAAAVQPLRHAPADGLLRARWMAARTAAVLSLTAAWIHIAFVESHWADWWAYGLTFVAMGAGQAVFVPLLLRRASTWLVVCGIAGNLAIVAMYVWSRTAGIPLGPDKGVVERAAPIDLASTAAEIALIGVLLVMLGRGARRWVIDLMLVAGVLLWVARLTNHLP